LDDKGRLVLPARFRDDLSDGLVLTKGQDRSVVVWPVREFSDYSSRIQEASRTDARARAYSRVLFSAASDEVPDKQGRISIPVALREYAGLERECIVVGNHSTIEIWNPQSWEAYLADQEPGFADLTSEVVPGLF
jgi:MraZ protein